MAAKSLMTFASKFVFLTPNCLQYRPIFIFPAKRSKTSSEKEENPESKKSFLNEKAWTMIRLFCRKNGNELDDIYNALATSITQW